MPFRAAEARGQGSAVNHSDMAWTKRRSCSCFVCEAWRVQYLNRNLPRFVLGLGTNRLEEALASIDATNTANRAMPKLERLEQRYYLSLISMAVIDLTLFSIFLLLSGKFSLIVLRLPEVCAFLIFLNLIGAFRLFRPIRHFLLTGQGRDAAEVRAARLGPMTAIWVTIVSLLFTISSFIITPFVFFDVPLTPEVAFILVGRALTWFVLLPYVAVIMLQEYLRLLRRSLYEDYGIAVPAGHSKLGRKLVLIFLGGAVVPAVSIAITLLMVPEVSPISGQPRSVVVVTTIAGATIALLLAFWATQRSTSAGFRSLLHAMRQMRKGELDARVVIETDDELGRLGEGFNALSQELAISKAETARKEAERAQAARQFHEAQKREALGRLSAGISHDFNNILAIIVMYSDTVRTRLPAGDPNRKRLEEVLIAAGRGKDLISQILDFTRDKAEEHENFDLVGNVRETINLLAETVAKEIDIAFKGPDQTVMVCGYPTGIHQVVANLSINAIHAIQGRAARLEVEVDVSTPDAYKLQFLKEKFSEAENNTVFRQASDGTAKAYLGQLKARPYGRIRVTDNGSGMTLTTLRHVFDPYFTTKPVGEGTGLGLAAVAGIAAAHHGGVVVETSERRGTSFFVYLPLLEEKDSARDG